MSTYREQQRLQKEEELRELAESIGYTVNSEYSSAHKKVQMTCGKGHEIEISPSNFKSGKRCVVCAGQCPKAAENSFIELAESIGYKVNGKYVNSGTKVSMICDKGHYFDSAPVKLKSGNRCPVCAGCCPKAAKNDFYDLAASINFTVNGKYVNSDTKVSMICDKGHDFDMTPTDFKSGRRCSSCAESGFDQGKDATLYLYRWTLGDKSFIKYGITNNENHTKRIRNQAGKTEYTPELIKEVRGSGEDIWAAERLIKEELGGKYASQEEFADGYTETLEDNEYNIGFIDGVMGMIK